MLEGDSIFIKISNKFLKYILFTIIILLYTFFVNLNINADSIRPQVNGNNDSYVNNIIKDDGYKEPADVNNPGAIVHVKDANELLRAIGYKKGGGVYQGASSIHKIILDSDINIKDASDYSRFSSGGFAQTGRTLPAHKNLIIDGNGHTLDMMQKSMSITGNQNENWTLENMKLYGANYYGPVRVNVKNTTLNYRNIDYYGAQLLWTSDTPNININMYGNVGVHSLLTYKSLNGNNIKCQSGGDQQNMQAGDLEFHKNSNYYGETYNGNCLELYGSSTLDDNAKVELHPHGSSAENRPSGYGSSGIYLRKSGNYKSSKLEFGSNDYMLINCDSSNIYDSDGSSYSPNRPKVLSAAFFAASQTDTNLNNGNNSKFIVSSKDGAPGNNSNIKNNSKPLVNFDSVNVNLSGYGNEFDINSDADNVYIPKNGLFSTSKSTINVTNGGTFKMNIKNIPRTNTTNYLLDSQNSIINIFRPGEVKLQNSTFNANQNNYLNLMGDGTSNTYNNINAKDVSITANNYMQNPPLSLNNIIAKQIVLPLIENRIYVPGTRLMGSYFNVIKFANGLNRTIESNNTAQNFNYIDFKGTPIPKTTSFIHNNVNTYNRNISGKVVDENGNPIVNSYVKIRLNSNGKYYEPKDNSEDNNSFYQNDDNYLNYINSQEIVYNVLRKYLPNDLGSFSGGDMTSTSNDFYSSMSGANIGGIPFPVIKPNLKRTYFKYANQYFFNNYDIGPYNQFNAGTTTYNKDGSLINSDPYVATTDSNGNFNFKVPNTIFNNLHGRDYLNVVPSYNFTDGKPQKLLISYNPLVSIKNTIKDVSFPKGNSTDGMTIKQVFQGGQGYGEKGDTLDFSNAISNTADNSDISDATYTQPVPKSIDNNTLQVSYDNGKTFIPLDDKDYNETDNDNGSKNINLRNINIRSGGTKNITLRGTMKATKSVNNDSIKLKPYLTYGDNYVDSGNENYIDFTDNSFIFKPNNINFGDVAKVSKNELLRTINDENPIITNVKNNIRDKTPVNILVQQNSKKFYSNNSEESFNGQLMYKESSLLNKTEIFNTNDSSDLYLSNRHPLYLLPEENMNVGGDYKTNLTWSINKGIH